MKSKLIIISASITLALAGCSDDADAPKGGDVPSGPVARSTVKLTPPIEFSSDPVEKQKQQEGMVQSMLEDPNIPFDQIEGEAYRRGVTLTPEQIAAKRAQTQGAQPPATQAPGAN